jgi:glucose/mannose-6-phosphate isomerase
MKEITRNHIKKIDRQNFISLIENFPNQIDEAVNIGKSTNIKIDIGKVKNIIITGLGGSAIGGDILRSYLINEISVPISVNRNYFLPKYVNENTLVFVSSYSGNTEETISAFQDALNKKAQVIAVTTGGQLGGAANQFGVPVIRLKTGFPPRQALGYSVITMLVTLAKLEFINSQDEQLKETLEVVKEDLKVYGIDSKIKNNSAKEIASKLFRKFPVIYSSVNYFDVIAQRWKDQFSENSKTFAHYNVFPEMNHNEIVGWKFYNNILDKTIVIFFKDEQDNKRIQIRMEIIERMLNKIAGEIIEIKLPKVSLLARIFSLIYLGDWVSYYLAILNNINPMEIKAIDKLKYELSKFE